MEGKLSRAQQEAKMYVENHRLEKFVGEMLNALVHSKDPNPSIFMIKYLANTVSPEELANHGITIEGKLPPAKAPAKYPQLPEQSLLKPVLTRELWQRIHEKKTRFKATFEAVLQLSSEEYLPGLVAPDEDAYTVFSQLFLPVAEEYHSWDRNSPYVSVLHKPQTFPNLDESGRFIKSTRARLVRNFTGFPFSVALHRQERERIEQKVLQLLNELVCLSSLGVIIRAETIHTFKNDSFRFSFAL